VEGGSSLYCSNYETHAVIQKAGRPELFVTMVGIVALALGILIYIFDRSATAVYFVPDSSVIAKTTPLLFGTLGNYLPAFLHTLAFALFANAIAGRRYIGLMCIGWFVAEAFLELAQIDAIAFRIAEQLPGWFYEWPILENVSSHFLTGYFDTLDIVFLMLGCITAYLIGYVKLPKPYNRHQPRNRIMSRSVRLAGLLFIAFVGFTSTVSSGGTGETLMVVSEGSILLAQP
jgi:hypothetical protein